jgi:hypothetical protein
MDTSAETPIILGRMRLTDSPRDGNLLERARSTSFVIHVLSR